MSETPKKTSTGLEENIAGLLCYVAGWITGIIFLVLEKDNQFVRFHAIQSIVVFGFLTILSIIFSFIWFLGWIVWALTVIAWIILMVKAYQGQKYKIWIAGKIAEDNSKPKGS